ncbi:helix-turn-helix transcriptional regulator [Halorubrum ezzemoulense]|uniref:Helix-turn-helix transcriptional regulator n=1 Tax=Halorubrum ezzemoulense TaxID=337243 RepID=A0ABT4Z1G1_HALEZ|nr:helix-turn-helix transcriptional regulator [Halorubrum ezzemoulense]MDB2244536.1 helix-turn-helix transcriptional regulator [Halorubrum ezzemoulense]MDB2250743.1 helix-turn-helix transcriptional regulator [Halorubrum ezzemoulense]MDB2278707.1 helix-turn-helix transcriptional regulator [Halorubrum ezzemoulense]MDB2285381.1 helix-turn-helix transcriptional regulator [Halorubrum ezzemoulense]MDB2287870.1 helix-turn-helix transcriptional regulator [Halorubrum ezzemoulense]
MDFETRIRELREEAGLTQAELADRVDVTRQTVLYVEKGEYNPSLELAWRIAREFDARIEEVFELPDRPRP